ncbi:MAG: aquaporin [Deltaproteobacteria bacterium]
MTDNSLSTRALSEVLGTAMLLATIVGSGIMADALSGGNAAVALLANSVATGAILVVLITLFGTISGAHFNPAVSLVAMLSGKLPLIAFAVYVTAQMAGALAGVQLAHIMFDQPVMQVSETTRTGSGQWVSEIVATFGLVLAILLAERNRPEWIGLVVGLYITSAYWFTASTSFANPAVTVARSATNTFAGIAPASAPAFIAAQLAGAMLALAVARYFAR